MQHAENNSAQTVSYFFEHSHGTCELWIKRSDVAALTTHEPLKLLRVSGKRTDVVRLISQDPSVYSRSDLWKESFRRQTADLHGRQLSG